MYRKLEGFCFKNRLRQKFSSAVFVKRWMHLSLLKISEDNRSLDSGRHALRRPRIAELNSVKSIQRALIGETRPRKGTP